MKHEIKSLGDRPLIMGILNVTPDSFSDGGEYFELEKAVEHACFIEELGADIIDVGGESSRPNAESVSLDEELSRVVPVIEKIRKRINIPISIDTVKAEIAEEALKAGASIINDISGLQNDERIAELAAKYKAYLILMHMRGTPRNMQMNTEYENLVGEIYKFLENAAHKAVLAGAHKEKIIVDPGIGFGKSVESNFVILNNLDRFINLGYPILVGASRKSFIGKTLDVNEKNRLEGSLAAACYAVLNGADIIRVHDVLETKRALTIIEKIVTSQEK